jgi:hypothetical protein
MSKPKQPHRPPMGFKGPMNRKQSPDLTPEPDLQEHRRLITRALTQNVARPGPDPGATTWQVVLVSVGLAVLFIAAGAALFLASVVFLQ